MTKSIQQSKYKKEDLLGRVWRKLSESDARFWQSLEEVPESDARFWHSLEEGAEKRC